MFRSWGVVTLTGDAEPLFGDVTTAAVPLPLGNEIIPVTVADTSLYEVGDRIVLDPGEDDADTLLVIDIPDNVTLNCRSEGDAPTHTHDDGTTVMLSIACAEIIAQFVSTSTGVAYLGSDDTVTVTPDGSAVYELASTSPVFRATHSAAFNSVRTSDLWIVGPDTVKVIVSAEVI